MKTIIAGSRTIKWASHLLAAISDSNFQITEVVSGGAFGVDRMGEKWAKDHNVPICQFLPMWDEFGKKAGVMRNQDMADYAEALIAVWDGVSRGTKDMIERATKKGLKVYVYKPNQSIAVSNYLPLYGADLD